MLPPRRQVMTAVKLARPASARARIALRRSSLKPGTHHQESCLSANHPLPCDLHCQRCSHLDAARPPSCCAMHACMDAASAASSLSAAACPLPCLQYLHPTASAIAPVLPPWVPVPRWSLLPPASIAAAAAAAVVVAAVWLSAAGRPKPAMVLLLLTLVPPLLSRRRHLAAVPAVVGRRRRPPPIVPARAILPAAAIALPPRAAG
jgi:hypothetical protein